MELETKSLMVVVANDSDGGVNGDDNNHEWLDDDLLEMGGIDNWYRSRW